MKHLFLDTNVLIDFLADRQPYSTHAAILFSLADKGTVLLHVSAISFNNIYYVIRKVAPHKKTMMLLAELESMVEVIAFDKGIVNSSLNTDFHDFEDAIQHQSSLNHKKIECIVSRNLRDFKKSRLPVFSPETMVKMLGCS